MTYINTVKIDERSGGALSAVVERALGLKRSARVIVLRAGRAMILVPEDPEIRRAVDRNERILRERGATVNDVLKVLRKSRRSAGPHVRTQS
ncbi:MAG: hypothetical protein HY897_09035 [Deltaproteobacteria bacterium]|nr:hypothetical protein [Deltaproteobacteria bacterium]